MTGEGVSDTESWVESKKAAYAYAYDKGGKLKGWFGISGIPAAVLVDPTGKIVWRGHPGNLDAATVEEHLAGALTTPLYEWAGEASKTRKALLDSKYKKALGEAEKIQESHPEVLATVQSVITGRVGAFQLAKEEGDYLAMTELGESLKKGLSGLPEADEVDAQLKALKKDKDAQKILKAQKKIGSLLERKMKKATRQKVVEELKALRKKFPDTVVERDADAALLRLRDM